MPPAERQRRARTRGSPIVAGLRGAAANAIGMRKSDRMCLKTISSLLAPRVREVITIGTPFNAEADMAAAMGSRATAPDHPD